MTITHRAFSAAFGTRHSAHLPTARPADRQEAESRPYGMTGRITSSPWEGLYLQDDETTEPALEGTGQVSAELERFLTSLMCGE